MLLIKVMCLGGVILEYHDSSLLKERKVSLKVACLFIFTNSILVRDNRGNKWQLQITMNSTCVETLHQKASCESGKANYEFIRSSW